jgi:hypothetical protein
MDGVRLCVRRRQKALESGVGTLDPGAKKIFYRGIHLKNDDKSGFTEFPRHTAPACR